MRGKVESESKQRGEKMQEEFEKKKNQTWAKEEVRVRKKREIKVRGGRKKRSIFQTGEKNAATERGFTEKKGKNATLQFGMLVFK